MTDEGPLCRIPANFSFLVLCPSDVTCKVPIVSPVALPPLVCLLGLNVPGMWCGVDTLYFPAECISVGSHNVIPIYNPKSEPIAFSVHVTHPQEFFITPSQGTLCAYEEAQLSVQYGGSTHNLDPYHFLHLHPPSQPKVKIRQVFSPSSPLRPEIEYFFGNGARPPDPPPPPDGSDHCGEKNEIYHWENLVGPFWYTNFWVPVRSFKDCLWSPLGAPHSCSDLDDPSLPYPGPGVVVGEGQA